jgi:hypothetical protein
MAFYVPELTQAQLVWLLSQHLVLHVLTPVVSSLPGDQSNCTFFQTTATEASRFVMADFPDLPKTFAPEIVTDSRYLTSFPDASQANKTRGQG